MFVFGDYNEFTFLLTQMSCQLFLRQLSQSLHCSSDQSTLDAHGIERLVNFQVHFEYIEALF